MFKKLRVFKLLLFLISSFFICLSVNADQDLDSNQSSDKGLINVNWNQLNLNTVQQKRINELDNQWKQLENLVKPKIIRDQQTLKNIIKNPNVKESNIRQLQKDIMLRQEQLRNEATENFLSKRRLLNSNQKTQLHKMLSK